MLASQVTPVHVVASEHVLHVPPATVGQVYLTHKFDECTPATNVEPSAEEATSVHGLVLPTEVSSVQVAPESVEVHKLPSLTAATSFVPFAEDATDPHSLVLPTEVTSVHVP